MAHDFALQEGWEPLLVLGIGVVLLVAPAAVAGRCVASPRWQAAIWRIATLSLLVLCSFELTGVGRAVVQLCRHGLLRDAAVLSARQSTGAAEKPLIKPDKTGTGTSQQPVFTGPSLLGSEPVPVLSSETMSGGQSRFSFPEHGTVPLGNVTVVPSPVLGTDCPHPLPLSGAPAQWVGERGVLLGVLAPPPRGTDFQVGPSSEAAGGPLPGVEIQARPSSAAPRRSWWLAVVWAMGAAVVLARFVGGRIAAWIFRRSCAPCDDATSLAQVEALKSRFGVRRAVAVLKSSRIAAPVVLGGWRPSLVLPSRFVHDFDSRQQEAILAHELAHLVARDPVWQAAALAVCGLLWWHPLAWWSRRQLRAASESAADEASLVVPDGPRILAEALMVLGRRLLRGEPQFGLALGGGRFRSRLGQRVQRLLAPSAPLAAAAAGPLGLCPFFFAGAYGTGGAFGNRPSSLPSSLDARRDDDECVE